MGNGSFQRRVRCSSEMSKNIFFTTGPHEGADDGKKEGPCLVLYRHVSREENLACMEY